MTVDGCPEHSHLQTQWLLVKDVPNAVLRHLRLPNNQMRPFPHSRDTQEVPYTQVTCTYKYGARGLV